MSRRTAAWLAWSVCAVCVALIVLTFSLDFFTDDRFTSSGFILSQRPGPAFVVLTGMLSLVYPAVGAIIASRLPTNPIGWIFCGVGLLYTTQRFTQAYADYALLVNFAFPGGEYMAWFSRLVDITGLVLAGVFVMLLFPDGSLPSRRWRIVAWKAVCGAVLTALYAAFYPHDLSTPAYVPNPFGWVGVIGGGLTTYDFLIASALIGETLLLTSSLAAICSVALRLHRAWGDERQQLKWFLYAAVPASLCFSFVLLTFIVADFTELVFGTPLIPFWENYYDNILYVAVFALLVVPIFTYISIVRHHLYDIDVVINRTLVYGALTSCVVGIYVLAVVALGALFQTQGNIAVSLLATGLVAVLFQPLRSRLQRGVNRLMYGERDDPYAVVSRLGRRLEATLAPDRVLPTLVETIAQALKLPYAAILLKDGEEFRTAAAYGSPLGEPETLPLVYQREEIGRLVIAPRAPGEGFSVADRRLLEDLARQAEVAVHAVRLTSDLQHSRERLVATREEERRRLRRDLHDSLGAQLAGLNVQAGALRRLIPRDPDAADELVVELRDELRYAISDIRRLAYDLRPPALDDLGLVEALRRLAERYGSEDEQLSVLVEVPEDLPDLPAAVEVAIYRITQEALTNVARHARARTCVVRLAMDEDVALEIVDDGIGIPAQRSAGVGLSSMHERASELGGSCVVQSVPKGGTQVLVRLPLPKE
ncbi:MAG: GAF domain-containing sensor histidine kinase [Actinomycetota bacterium]|nr:GAF domain-containing sensor histidine kinase [Actinomycetota bacterium]